MSTRQGRLAQTKQMIDFPETTFLEALNIIRHWLIVEVLLRRERRLVKKIRKHGAWMNDTNEILILRHNLRNL